MIFLLGVSALSAADDAIRSMFFGSSLPTTIAVPSEIGSWTFPVPERAKHDGELFEIKGDPKTCDFWRSDAVSVTPGGLYRFKMNACWFGGGNGCFPAGIEGATTDYGPTDAETPDTLCQRMIRVGDNVKEVRLAVGQYQSDKTFRFTTPELTAVWPIYRGIASKQNSVSSAHVMLDGQPVAGAQVTSGDLFAVTDKNGVATFQSKYANDFLPLAFGEHINGTKYRFYSFRNPQSGNFDRTLFSARAGFNSNRWCMGNHSEVVYKLALQPVRVGAGPNDQPEPIRFTDGVISVNVQYFFGGRLVVEASADGQNWKPVGTLEEKGLLKGTPENFFSTPLDTVYIRCRGEKTETDANFQIYNVHFDGVVDSADYSGFGETIYADIADTDSASGAFTALPLFFNDDTLYYGVTNNSDKPLDWNPAERIIPSVGEASETPSEVQWASEFFGASNSIPAKGRAIIAQEYIPTVHAKEVRFDCRFDRTYSWTKSVSTYLVQDYTHAVEGLSGAADGVDFSWTFPERKVPQSPKIVKILDSEPIKIAAPRNDFESFQILLRPTRLLSGITASVSDLQGPDGAVLSASNVQVCYGYYHFVDNPTDPTCAAGRYADALVPLDKGSDGLGAALTVKRGENLPIFTSVYVPSGTKAGVYTGTLSIRDASGSLDAKLPFALEVWDFDQPAKGRFETAYGFDLGNIFLYHNAQTDEQRRAVWERYLKSASDHRISLYNPTPMDSYSVKWDKENLTCEIDFTRFDREMERVLSKYNITTIKIDVQGLGGGTFEGRQAGKLFDYNEDAPEYDKLMTDYLGKLEAHLAEKGWLDKCYCYWFDEPEPKDYEFVAGGFGKLKKYIPGLGRMLTEQPGDQLCGDLEAAGGNVNIWCPISDAYSIVEAKKRMENGERFWWYVCCGPKAPYCTEFTDHPGHELRLWHWQAFERDIVGSLVWITNYWTSPTAFPTTAQNPYIDPMCYVVSGNLTPGTKQFWGNGDGRFMYPPLCAAVPGRNNGEFIDEPPVTSIRWEALREGIEDYEMLLTLRERFEAKKMSLSDAEKAEVEALFDFSDLTESMTKFTGNPGVIAQHREKVAQAILRLK